LRHNEGRGLVVKAGYVTNKCHYHFTGLANANAVISKVRTIQRQVQEGQCYPVPYLMLQPCMLNRKEKKVFCVNGIYQYVTHPQCSSTLGHGYRYSGNMEERCKVFAERALHQLKEKVPHCILDGLARVDIFETAWNDANGEPIWVVNEIETLEAAFGGGGGLEFKVSRLLTEYWVSIFRDLLQQYQSKLQHS
jgi:hypothetical protein